MFTILKLIKAKWVFKKPGKKNILIYDGNTQAQFIFSKKRDVEFSFVTKFSNLVLILTLESQYLVYYDF